MWQKSSLCRFDQPACVEVIGLNGDGEDEYIEVRNSRNPHTIISFDREEWKIFIQGVKRGEFDPK